MADTTEPSQPTPTKENSSTEDSTKPNGTTEKPAEDSAKPNGTTEKPAENGAKPDDGKDDGKKAVNIKEPPKAKDGKDKKSITNIKKLEKQEKSKTLPKLLVKDKDKTVATKPPSSVAPAGPKKPEKKRSQIQRRFAYG